MLAAYQRITFTTALLCSIFYSGLVFGLEKSEEFYLLANQLEFIVDEKGEITIDQLLNPETAQQWISSKNAKPKPQHAHIPIWLKLTLSSEELQKPQVLTALTTNYDEILIYRSDPQGHYHEFITGNRYPAAQRDIETPRYSFNIRSSDKQQTIYLRVTGGLNINNLGWALLEQQQYNHTSYIFWMVNLLSVGALIGIFIFNAGIGITLQNRNYIFYSAYIFCAILSLTNLDGLAFMVLWPKLPAFNAYANDIFTMGIAITRLLTILHFLHIKQLAPRLYLISKYWVIFLILILVVASTVGLKHFSEILGGLLWLFSMMFGLVISLYAIVKKAPLAKPIFLVLIIPLIGSLAQGLVEIGIFESGVIKLQLAKIGFVVHALLFSICIALQIKTEVDAKVIAQHDGLTGLPSLKLTREHFQKIQQMAQRKDWKVAVLFIDLDGFKAVNDTYGHEMGDKLLINVTSRIQSIVRQSDIVARIGGDEFLIIQPEVKKPESATAVAKKVISMLSIPFIIDDKRIRIGASVGISLYPDHADNLNDLMTIADKAMYTIKKSGKNNFLLHS